MATDKANAEKKPDGAQWIRIARAYAMCSLVDGSPQIEMLNKSIDAVEKAVAEGFTDWPDMLSEPDLIAIHDDPRFLTIVQGIKSDTQSANTK